jgi:LacI family transcriptional regulator, galactose operon repressor
VSFDESEALEFFYSPISYINQSTARIGKEAVKILMKQLNQDDDTQINDISQIIIDAPLVMRESCGEKRI